VLKLINISRGKVLFSSYMLLMSSFLVFDAKGGKVLGIEAMKIVSNTTKLKILILQVVLVLCPTIGSK
jgi:hypothetical protein